jgi:hypothetical protein
MFVIDKSYSIHEELFLEAVQLVHEVADIIFENSGWVKLGAIVFDGGMDVLPLTMDPATFHSGLDALNYPAEDLTLLAPALDEAITNHLIP